jgi:hypothetical protein
LPQPDPTDPAPKTTATLFVRRRLGEIGLEAFSVLLIS